MIHWQSSRTMLDSLPFISSLLSLCFSQRDSRNRLQMLFCLSALERTIKREPNDPHFMNAIIFPHGFISCARQRACVYVCVRERGGGGDGMCARGCEFSIRIGKKRMVKMQIRKTKNGLRIKFQWLLWTELNNATAPSNTAFNENENRTDAVLRLVAVRISDTNYILCIHIRAQLLTWMECIRVDGFADIRKNRQSAHASWREKKKINDYVEKANIAVAHAN